jgi:hypothetical protein
MIVLGIVCVSRRSRKEPLPETRNEQPEMDGNERGLVELPYKLPTELPSNSPVELDAEKIMEMEAVEMPPNYRRSSEKLGER